MWLTPIGELHRYGLRPSQLRRSSQFRTIRLLSPMSLLFQISEYRPGIRKVILIHGKKKVFFPYVIFIRNRITGSFHVCFAEKSIRSRFATVYLPGRLVSNIICITEICLSLHQSRFSLVGGIERFWWSPFDSVEFHPSCLDITITRMRKSPSRSLGVFLWMCLMV